MVTRPRARRTTLAGQLLVLQVAVILVVLVLVGALSLAQSEATFTRVEGRRVSALAEQLGGNPLVRSNLEIPETRTGLATLAQSFATQSSVGSVTFADADEDVRVSTNPSLEDMRIPLPREAVGEGASWSGTLTLDGQRDLVSQVPVFSVTDGRVGEHLGTVMITEPFPSAWERARGASSYLLTYVGGALLIGLLGSWLLARRIKRQTLGMEPSEIAGLAEHREALLHGIAEGVIALDPQGRVTLVNDVARRLLDLPDHAEGLTLADLRVRGRLLEVLSGSDDDNARDRVVVRRGHVLVMNRMHVERDGRPLGTVTTLRDRTALADMERQLGTFRSTTQLLRAQAHEFANQLHTISGLIQIGEYDEVVSYVDTVSQRRHSLDLSINSRVGDPAVAALLMAKASLASERRIDLRITDTTSLQRLQPEDSADVGTVIGNLVDNALDAVTSAGPKASPAQSRTASTAQWVEVTITQDQSSVEIVVSDSGPGVPDEIADEVFDQGFTTKPGGDGTRGIGLALTRMLCEQRGGEIIMTPTDTGARFTARLGVTASLPEGVPS
ncbi:ATP-binding protein [Janibacter sp. HTCC2649]|uniref:sensor histidine kinase n=1 Tax=Janibacter sp. HTCC2649 TaxID=313589 RepID=UPI0002FA2944|nr:ATP-binding protein [Janibacter sp. HTCC2649]